MRKVLIFLGLLSACGGDDFGAQSPAIAPLDSGGVSGAGGAAGDEAGAGGHLDADAGEAGAAGTAEDAGHGPDGATGGQGGAGGAEPTPCPDWLPGPALVPVDGYCIDATEVTVGQYRAWLNDAPELLTPAPCAQTELSPVPAEYADNEPMRKVTWCDAYSYCAAAGKSLCGATNGTTLAYDYLGTAIDAWLLACSDNVSGCNFASAGVIPVAASESCRTPTGAYDLLGIVAEWTDTVQNAGCAHHGDSFDVTPSTCNDAYGTLSCSGRYERIGFRCCWYS